MIVIREFRKGNLRYEKGQRYTENDAGKWLKAGFLKEDVTEKSEPKGQKGEAK